jgi:hypothetical protein
VIAQQLDEADGRGPRRVEECAATNRTVLVDERFVDREGRSTVKAPALGARLVRSYVRPRDRQDSTAKVGNATAAPGRGRIADQARILDRHRGAHVAQSAAVARGSVAIDGRVEQLEQASHRIEDGAAVASRDASGDQHIARREHTGVVDASAVARPRRNAILQRQVLEREIAARGDRKRPDGASPGQRHRIAAIDDDRAGRRLRRRERDGDGTATVERHRSARGEGCVEGCFRTARRRPIADDEGMRRRPAGDQRCENRDHETEPTHESFGVQVGDADCQSKRVARQNAFRDARASAGSLSYQGARARRP